MASNAKITCIVKYPGFPDVVLEEINSADLNLANNGDESVQMMLANHYFDKVGVDGIPSNWTWTMMVVGLQTHLADSSQEGARD